MTMMVTNCRENVNQLTSSTLYNNQQAGISRTCWTTKCLLAQPAPIEVFFGWWHTTRLVVECDTVRVSTRPKGDVANSSRTTTTPTKHNTPQPQYSHTNGNRTSSSNYEQQQTLGLLERPNNSHTPAKRNILPKQQNKQQQQR
jgi:hypothetical protein